MPAVVFYTTQIFIMVGRCASLTAKTYVLCLRTALLLLAHLGGTLDVAAFNVFLHMRGAGFSWVTKTNSFSLSISSILGRGSKNVKTTVHLIAFMQQSSIICRAPLAHVQTANSLSVRSIYRIKALYCCECYPCVSCFLFHLHLRTTAQQCDSKTHEIMTVIQLKGCIGILK